MSEPATLNTNPGSGRVGESSDDESTVRTLIAVPDARFRVMVHHRAPRQLDGSRDRANSLDLLELSSSPNRIPRFLIEPADTGPPVDRARELCSWLIPDLQIPFVWIATR